MAATRSSRVESQAEAVGAHRAAGGDRGSQRGAARGGAGSQRLARQVPAMPSAPATAVTATASATSWTHPSRPAGYFGEVQNAVVMRMAGWLAAAAVSQSRPTSGPLTSKAAATRRA